MVNKVKVIEQFHSENWSLYNGDSVNIIAGIPDNSLDYSIFSPPFASLFTYSKSAYDMGNSSNMKSFMEQFSFLISELLRTIKPGRLVSVHCMNLPMTVTTDGVIGLKDFRGEIIQEFTKTGWIYHSEVTVWKDPLIQAVRTKTLGLLHKQLCKDSNMCQQGLPDYVVTFRKPGINKEPIHKPDGFAGVEYPGDPKSQKELMNGNYSHNFWRKIASPVWDDIRQTHVLNYKTAKEKDDEKHISPLQLDVIDRCILLWSNPGDIVFSPFAGIGSEIHEAIKLKRKGIGIELKPSYFETAVKNVKELEYSADISVSKFFG